MQILTFLFSGLAFAAAATALILVLQERRRMHIRFANFTGKAEKNYQGNRKFLMEQLDERFQKAAVETAEQNKKTSVKIGQVASASAKALKQSAACAKRLEDLEAIGRNIAEQVGKTEKRLDDLENGVIPDYEEAKRAVDAVNDINKGITGILGFDPMDALRKSRLEGE